MTAMVILLVTSSIATPEHHHYQKVTGLQSPFFSAIFLKKTDDPQDFDTKNMILRGILHTFSMIAMIILW